ncbi:MAG: glycosyltransferase [Bacteroidetes bacterium]|nr:glycosyltransferase [Bacteroidota bacterium]
MLKVLVIAYYFPPLGLSGVQRTLKFVKYLKNYGWDPTVLTVSSRGYYAKDDSLLLEAENAGIEIVRTDSIDPNRFFRKQDVVPMPSERWRKFLSRVSDTFFIPDNKIGWKSPAIKKASELIKKNNYDIIFATAPPYTSFLIGKELRDKFHIPLVLDFRDLWVGYPFKFFPTYFHKRLFEKMESQVVKSADAIVVASRRVKESLIRRYNHLQYNEVKLISQGYDEEDIKIDLSQNLPLTNKMRFTYTGVFYEDRTPKYFLEALANVFQKNPNLKNKIEVCFVGILNKKHLELIKKLQLQDAVNICGYLSHKECIKYLLASDVLWLMMKDDLSSPGKIYEYIGTGKKIMGCVPTGFIRDTIEEANGFVTTPDNVNEISTAILTLYNEFENKKLKGASSEVISKYNRKELTGELAKTFIKLIHVD